MNEEILLVGKPNSGKTSLFNQLTGLNQKVGNYAGVTVEIQNGSYKGKKIIDLPGLRSLRSVTPEEKISKDFILSIKEGTGIIFTASGTNLSDDLLLFSELADLELPMILVINFKDELDKNHIKVNVHQIRDLIGCPVLLINSKAGDGLAELKHFIEKQGFKVPYTFCKSLYEEFSDHGVQNNYRQSISDSTLPVNIDTNENDFLKRQKIISSMIRCAVTKEEENEYLKSSKKWDKVLLHPIWGMLIFLSVMYLVFQAVFAFSSIPMDWIDGGMSSLSEGASKYIPEGWFRNLVADAIIPGIGGVVIFIPQIAILFFLLGILEHTGYLSRISYISDAFLRKFGLSGKSIIPLMSSWACAIPAIMSTRVIDDPRERMAVIMASPLMTCSARLPVYTILISVIYPEGGGGFFGTQGLMLLALYLLGVIATLVVAWFISRRSKIPKNPFWSLELPVYRMPNWRNILTNVYLKTKSFVVEAGKVIFAISILLWLLASFSPKSEDFVQKEFSQYTASTLDKNKLTEEAFELEYSYLGYLGKGIEPIIKPLGYDWKIGIALITSFAAREVFVGTISTVYSIGSEEDATIVERLRNEINPENGQPRYNYATAISLLLFYVFALQCMSTLAIVRKETGQWKFALWQFVAFLIMAYVFALLAYQLLK